MENQNTVPDPNIQPAAQSPQIIAPPITSTAKASKLPFVIVFTLFLASLSAAAYFFYQSQTLKQEIASLPQNNGVSENISPKPFTQTTPDPNSDWLLYTSPYGYSFKYPPFVELKTQGWQQQTSNNELINHQIDGKTEAIIVYDDPLKPGGGGPSLYYTVWIQFDKPVANNQGLTSLQFAQQTITGLEDLPEVKFQSVTIAGRPATKATFLNTTYYIPHNQQMYQITYTSGAPYIPPNAPPESKNSTFSSQELNNIVTQILSTIEFTD
jgi:hypothetical protein